MDYMLSTSQFLSSADVHGLPLRLARNNWPAKEPNIRQVNYKYAPTIKTKKQKLQLRKTTNKKIKKNKNLRGDIVVKK